MGMHHITVLEAKAALTQLQEIRPADTRLPQHHMAQAVAQVAQTSFQALAQMAVTHLAD
jgi:hypothetical protein